MFSCSFLFVVEGIDADCDHGVCHALSPGISLCDEFEYPCGVEDDDDDDDYWDVTAKCKNPCNLSIFIADKLSDPNFERHMVLSGTSSIVGPICDGRNPAS